MEVQSLTELTVEKAAQLLAEESLAGAELRAFGKEANIGSTLSSAWKGMQPWQKGLLVGTGGGALLGGLSSLGRRREERQPIQSAITGALAGGLLGGGLGVASQHGPEWFREGASNLWESGKNVARDIGRGLSGEDGPPPPAAITAEQISQMGPEDLAKLSPEQVQAGGLEALNAVESRQQQLLQDAYRGGGGFTPGPLGVATSGAIGAGTVANEFANRNFRNHNLLPGGSDVMRGAEAMPELRAQTGLSADQLQREASRLSQEHQRPLRGGNWFSQNLDRVRRAMERQEFDPAHRDFADTTRRVPNPQFRMPGRPDELLNMTEDQLKLLKQRMGVPQTITERAPSQRNQIRQLMEEGRRLRRSNWGGMPRRVGTGAGLMLLPLLADAFRRRSNSQTSAQQMAEVLGIE